MSKGGSTTSTVALPAWLEEAAKSAIGRANEVSNIGYTPYYGPDVAALTPQEIASMQGTNTAAAAFGMPTSDVTAGLPASQNYNGVSGYSSGPMYDAALAELRARRPGQYNALSSMFIDPVTGNIRQGSVGTAGVTSSSSSSGVAAPTAVNRAIAEHPDGSGRDRAMNGYSAQPHSGGTGSFGLPDPMSGRITGISPSVSSALGKTAIGKVAGLLGGVFDGKSGGGKSGGGGGSSGGSSSGSSRGGAYGGSTSRR